MESYGLLEGIASHVKNLSRALDLSWFFLEIHAETWNLFLLMIRMHI